MNPRKGTTPVPGPHMMMGVEGSDGMTKVEVLVNIRATALPSLWYFYKKAETWPILDLPEESLDSERETAIEQSSGCILELEAIV